MKIRLFAAALLSLVFCACHSDFSRNDLVGTLPSNTSTVAGFNVKSICNELQVKDNLPTRPTQLAPYLSGNIIGNTLRDLNTYGIDISKIDYAYLIVYNMHGLCLMVKSAYTAPELADAAAQHFGRQIKLNLDVTESVVNGTTVYAITNEKFVNPLAQFWTKNNCVWCSFQSEGADYFLNAPSYVGRHAQLIDEIPDDASEKDNLSWHVNLIPGADQGVSELNIDGRFYEFKMESLNAVSDAEFQKRCEIVEAIRVINERLHANVIRVTTERDDGKSEIEVKANRKELENAINSAL